MSELPTCKNCDGLEWVCENHTDTPWAGLSGEPECCGGAGAPCPCCNWEMATAGHRATEAELLDALEGLATAAFEYRKAHDLHGDGDLRTGRAWDKMRRKGDAADALITKHRGEVK